MVEVFKTNVTDRDQASLLVKEIQSAFSDYKATFDLDDCDKVLRVCCPVGAVSNHLLIGLLRDFGFEAEVLRE